MKHEILFCMKFSILNEISTQDLKATTELTVEMVILRDKYICVTNGLMETKNDSDIKDMDDPVSLKKTPG